MILTKLQRVPVEWLYHIDERHACFWVRLGFIEDSKSGHVCVACHNFAVLCSLAVDEDEDLEPAEIWAMLQIFCLGSMLVSARLWSTSMSTVKGWEKSVTHELCGRCGHVSVGPIEEFVGRSSYI